MFLKYEPEHFPDVENMKCERTTMRFPGSDPTQIQPDLGVWHLGGSFSLISIKVLLMHNKMGVWHLVESLNFYFTQFNC